MAVLNNSNAISSGGYDINNSLRFRSSASAYLSRTPTQATNRKTWTWSGWVKRGEISALASVLFMTRGSDTDATYLRFGFDFAVTNCLCLSSWNSTTLALNTTQVFRDPSAWYHIVLAFDTTQATASNRVRMYVNGNQITAFSTANYPSQNSDFGINNNTETYIGRLAGVTNYYFDGYMTDINFIDGQALTPSSFGETDATTGVWKAKAYTGTYGTNGFYLKFSDIATTSGSNAGLGKDFSGNANYWTTNNISVTAGVTYDAMTDVPTNTSATVANYPTLNPLSNGGATISNANLTTTANGATHLITNATFQMPTSGKYYWEITATTLGSTARIATGLLPNGTALTGYPWGNANTYGWYYGDSSNNIYWCSNSAQPFFIAGAVNDVLQICYDADNGTVYAGKNNVFYNSSGGTTGSPSTLTNPTSTGATATNAFFPATSVFTAGAFAINFGQRPFSYTPPTGFNRLNTFNLPTPTILQGNRFMDATTYTGNGGTLAVTGLSFQPDWVWIKSRNTAQNNYSIDAVRGINNILAQNTTDAESAFDATWRGLYGNLTAFNSNGFTVVDGTDPTFDSFNGSGDTYVGWSWKANGAGSSNTSGSITSTVSVNTTAGFSIVTYTGTGANATVGHGLGVAPSMIIIKRRNGVTDWAIYNSSIGNTKALFLNRDIAADTGVSYWNNTSPTSTLFTVGTGADVNPSSGTMVAYCFAEIAGFSKFTTYVGNGSTDGPFVYLGFRPKFVMVKGNVAGVDWVISDSSRNTSNVVNSRLFPATSAAENTGDNWCDFLSNGFKIRSTNTNQNFNTNTFVVMAFAENPFKNSLAR